MNFKLKHTIIIILGLLAINLLVLIVFLLVKNSDIGDDVFQKKGEVNTEIYSEENYDNALIKEYPLNEYLNFDYTKFYIVHSGNIIVGIEGTSLKFKSEDQIEISSGTVYIETTSPGFTIVTKFGTISLRDETSIVLDLIENKLVTIQGEAQFRDKLIPAGRIDKIDIAEYEVRDIGKVSNLRNDQIFSLLGFLEVLKIDID
ncbi:MAG: hypothetical protein Q9M76_05270 [Candidatus Dojkabacteria bacterium]|nr:hypothetical protein [Candidatus Dojkabacteria bacterium]